MIESVQARQRGAVFKESPAMIESVQARQRGAVFKESPAMIESVQARQRGAVFKESPAMIESVQARQRGAFNFEDHYDNLCALQDSVPLAAVKANLAKGILDLNGDRVRCGDWQPIINSIRINKTLQFIAIRSCYQVPVNDDVSEKRLAIIRRKLPAIRSKEITRRLMRALKDCLLVSPTLSGIEMQGLSLRAADILVLVKGIMKSRTLRHLSLENCRIGDDGLEVLCRGLKNTKNINSVNLSGCSLSPAGAEWLACLIKHQGVQRHNEAWQDSLRYRRPELDRMSGIRRVTANNNPLLGDEGAGLLSEALKDDLWLKALDLQSCGISNIGAKKFLDVLKYNTTLVVLDIRKNPLIEQTNLHLLMEQLMLNSNGGDREYKWMTADEAQEVPVKKTSRSRRRTTKVLNSSTGKKTTIKVTPTGSRHRTRACGGTTRRFEVPPSPGFPWRTAARANRFRGHPPDVPRFHADQSDDEVDESTSNNFVDNDMIIKSKTSCRPDSSSHMKRIKAETTAAMKRLEESHMSLDLTNEKEVLIELEQMRRQLKEERLTRARTDQQVITLMIENRKLTEEIAFLRKSQRPSRSILEDDSFLDSVETAFKQFHAFIDMLKEAGLGQLVSMAGLDQNQMSIISGNINKNFSLNGSPFFNNNNNSSSNARNGLTASHSKILPAYDSTLKNQHVDSSTSLNGRPKPTGQLTSKAAFSSKGAALQIADDDAESRTVPVGVYDEESEIARHEADELYSRLVKESRVALGQDIEVSIAGTTFTRPGLTENKGVHLSGQNESTERKKRTTVDSFDETNSKQSPPREESQVSYTGTNDEGSGDEASLYLSEREKHGWLDFREVETQHEADYSKDEDF